MFDIERLIQQLVQAGAVAARTLHAGLQLLGSPYRYHRARSGRMSESLRFCALSSVLMALLYFVMVSAVVDIRQPSLFLLGGGLLNVGHMVTIAAIYAVAGKVVARQVPARVHVESVFYATVLLPVVAFLSQPMAHALLKLMLAHPSALAYAYGYEPALAEALAPGVPAGWSSAGTTLAYVLFGYLIYVGLRVTAGLPRWRAAVAVAAGTLGCFWYQAMVLIPATQRFVRATTC